MKTSRKLNRVDSSSFHSMRTAYIPKTIKRILEEKSYRPIIFIKINAKIINKIFLIESISTLKKDIAI